MIRLAYFASKLDNMAFATLISDLGSATYWCDIPTTRIYLPEMSEERNVVTTLTGRIVPRVLHRRETVELTISPIVLDTLQYGSTTILEFLKDFWDADYKYLFLYNGYYVDNFIPVMTESEKFPVSYIEDISFLPEVNFRFVHLESY